MPDRLEEYPRSAYAACRVAFLLQPRMTAVDSQHMSASAHDRILELASQRGVLRARDVARHGLPTVTLTRLVRAGALERVARGLYALPSAPASEHTSLAEVVSLAPKAVVCLLSALAFHQIGTANPHRVWIALPHATKPPTSAPVDLEVVRMRPKALEAGVIRPTIDGVPIPVFNVPKTVADLFRYRNRVGLDVAIEALKEYWYGPFRDPAALHRYARIGRVEKLMRPYLQAIAA